MVHLLVPTAVGAAPYTSADFGGGLFAVTQQMKTELGAAGYNAALFNCSTCANATQVGGHVIFDAAVPVPVTTRATNVDSIVPISGVPDEQIFEINIDGLSFDFGDDGIQSGPFMQYQRGNFRGFAFVEDFYSPNQTPLQLSVQGGVFTVVRWEDFQQTTLLSGFITGLTNVQPFDPGAPPNGSVPEPGILGLLALGLAGLGVARRRKRKA